VGQGLATKMNPLGLNQLPFSLVNCIHVCLGSLS